MKMLEEELELAGLELVVVREDGCVEDAYAGKRLAQRAALVFRAHAQIIQIHAALGETFVDFFAHFPSNGLLGTRWKRAASAAWRILWKRKQFCHEKLCSGEFKIPCRVVFQGGLMVRRIIEKLREAVEKHFRLKEPEDVVVQISGPAMVFKESIAEEAERAFDKYERELEVENFTIRVKSSMTGSKNNPQKQLFELHGTLLFADKKTLHATATSKDPLTALKQLLGKIDAETKKFKSKEKNRPRRHFY